MENHWRRPLRMTGLALAAGLIASLCGAAALAADTITVTLDHARLMRLPDKVATIVVGNPLIADVSVQGGGMLVITAKGYGTTNLVVLDRAGNPLLDTLVQVQAPKDQVLYVHRGVERETYSCAPNCERRITLGDTAKYFEATMNQTGSLSGHAAGQQSTQTQAR